MLKLQLNLFYKMSVYGVYKMCSNIMSLNDTPSGHIYKQKSTFYLDQIH